MKTAKVIPFPNKDRDAIVDLIAELLAQAKEGRIKFFGYALVNNENVAYTGWAPDDDLSDAKLTSALGAANFLNGRLMDAALRGAVGEPPEVA